MQHHVPFLLLLFKSLPISSSHVYIEISVTALLAREMTVQLTSTASEYQEFEVFGAWPLDGNRSVYSVPIDLSHNYTLFINARNAEVFDVTSNVMRMKLPSRVITIVPGKVMPPMGGLRVEIKCQENWYGDKCEVRCDNRTAAVERRMCHSTGVQACLPGFKGTNCMEVLDPALCDCRNSGNCVYTFNSVEGELSCSCPDNFHGEKCENPVPKDTQLFFYTTFVQGVPWSHIMLMEDYYDSKMVKNSLGDATNNIKMWD